MPFFSVIVPLYNKENFIEATLQSILDQSFFDFEILIIDDSSTDSSLKIANTLASAKVKIIQHKKNQGLSAARNSGIKMASGQYIAFLDADDCWDVNYLETIVGLIDKYPEAKLFATNYLEIYSKTVSLTPRTKLQFPGSNFLVHDFFKSSLNQPIYCPSSLCVSKAVFNSIGCYEEKITFGEDVDFNIRVNTTFQLAYSTSSLVKYTVNSENQITTSTLKNKVLPNLDSYEILAKTNFSLKKYLDFHRYIFAKMYKIENDLVNYQVLKTRIHEDPKISGLNYKQRLLLNTPSFFLRVIQKTKRYFVNKGYRFTSY
ncbi:glycosyltransferase family 2 protein [Flavobacterium sp. F-380]|uniref:Glycosyltransferase family 2 protein n=1 Tax=Flavobacterium kayseriense TaxID=2764714 RepID=A0ABR7J6N5_9FLAO|nr:glycosyltransferase family 2 protein [Flavobacterium kayseriense]MBC5841200.1 glycosyltransferase family 2 protein [Flavobacterium kayseriense]MBC5847728.1 glycosyltransferase family 2 protein [Flavobacterium kayseriense]